MRNHLNEIIRKAGKNKNSKYCKEVIVVKVMAVILFFQRKQQWTKKTMKYLLLIRMTTRITFKIWIDRTMTPMKMLIREKIHETWLKNGGKMRKPCYRRNKAKSFTLRSWTSTKKSVYQVT